MARVRIPPADVPAVDPNTGKLVADWYDAFKALERLGVLDLYDVDTTPPTNGQVPIFVSATGKLTFGAN